MNTKIESQKHYPVEKRISERKSERMSNKKKEPVIELKKKWECSFKVIWGKTSRTVRK